MKIDKVVRNTSIDANKIEALIKKMQNDGFELRLVNNDFYYYEQVKDVNKPKEVKVKKNNGKKAKK